MVTVIVLSCVASFGAAGAGLVGEYYAKLAKRQEQEGIELGARWWYAAAAASLVAVVTMTAAACVVALRTDAMVTMVFAMLNISTCLAAAFSNEGKLRIHWVALGCMIVATAVALTFVAVWLANPVVPPPIEI
jgi:hypothetical protein